MSETPLLSVEEALRIISVFPVSPHGETIALSAARGRILASDIFSPIDMPEFDKSAMDGFAFNSKDRSPFFEIIETIAAGMPPQRRVTTGQCAKIMTGAMLPPGADRVVKRECTLEENGMMRITAEDKNRNVRDQGEDLRTGQRAMAKGVRLEAAQLALLASLGLAEAPVARQARVGIITTGSELAEPGMPLKPGQIYNSNSCSLAAQVSACGAIPMAMGCIADDLAATTAMVGSCLTLCDLLVISGGVSAGDFDFVPRAMTGAGIELHFQKIAVQPGMPTVFGSKDNKIVFGLPGNPVSTFVIFEVFIKPLLMRLMGHEFQPLTASATLENDYSRSQARRGIFLPVQACAGRATLVAYHGSAHLHALSRANALLYVPAGQHAIAAGSTVHVRYL